MEIKMKALSINQPWAWAIVNGGKRVENRTWKSKFRGRFLIHAGKKYDKEGELWIKSKFPDLKLPETFQVGGIVGVASIVDCVNNSDSPWFFGPYGFVLDEVKEVEFIQCDGMLSFFQVPVSSKQLKEFSDGK